MRDIYLVVKVLPLLAAVAVAAAAIVASADYSRSMRRLHTAIQRYAWGKGGSDSMVAQLKKVRDTRGLSVQLALHFPGVGLALTPVVRGKQASFVAESLRPLFILGWRSRELLCFSHPPLHTSGRSARSDRSDRS